MSWIETADMRPHMLYLGQLTTGSELVEELPSLPSNFDPPSLPFVLDQVSVFHVHSIILKKSAAPPYDLLINCARFIEPDTEKTGRLPADSHTTTTKLALLPSRGPESISLKLIPKLNVLVFFRVSQLISSWLVSWGR